MARTRQQTKTTSSSVIAASSDEEQREPEVFYTPVASKKPMRDSETPEIDSDTFYTPATKDASTKLPLRKKLSKSPRKRIVVEVPVSQEIRDLAAGASATPQSGRESGKITGGKAKRVEMLVDQLDKESSATTLSKSTKILATDDAVEEEETTRQDKEAIGSVVADSQEDGSDDDDDDDDAPEVVNTNVAMHAARQRDLNASTASKVQASELRKKRQHRDALLKLQAVNAQKRTRDDDDGEQEETSETITSDIGPQSSGTMLPTVIDQFNLPDELPLEYLQDDSPTAAALDTARPIKKHKIAHRVGSLASQSRDYRVGNITYRPSAVSQSLLLAPQVNRDVFRSKESWLQRRPGNVLKQGRQPCRKGFFTKQ